MSEIVGLSPSACHRRVGILEKQGVIERYAARLNGEKLGFNMTFYVEVTLEGQSESTPDTKDYERLYRRVISSLPHVSRIQSSLVMKTIKRWNGYPARLL